MRIRNIKSLLVLSICATVLYSCEKEDSPDSPGADHREKYLGTWHVTSQHSLFGTQFWDMTVSLSNSDPDEILLKDFNLQNGVTRRASVSGNSLSLVTENAGGETISGTGNYSGGNIQFTYTSYDGQQTDTVSATAQR